MNRDVPMDLLMAAKTAAERAYAPYSGFYVGAAAETEAGRVYTAANMENASYGLSICAEVGVLQQATTAGELSSVLRLAVVGGSLDILEAALPRIVTPCGRCRQLIAESAFLGKRDIEVWCASRNLEQIRCFTISELLPHSFSPDQPLHRV